MGDDMISKKDLLLRAGISYGQLYRWKRKGLIPDEWFVRKSTFTGQETFFPRERILARVERILSMKEGDLSLGDIAEAVSPKLDVPGATLTEAREWGLVSAPAADLFAEHHASDVTLAVGDLVALYALDTLLAGGDIGIDEGRAVLSTLEQRFPGFEGPAELVVIRKLGTTLPLLAPLGAELGLDPEARLVARVDITERAEALAARLATLKEENHGIK
jgi:DNA-binding transcriptional MerR regulator